MYKSFIVSFIFGLIFLSANFSAFAQDGIKLLPTNSYINRPVGQPVFLAIEQTSGEEAEEFTVTIEPEGYVILLKDDGIHPDLTSGDAVYTGQWIPALPGQFTILFPHPQDTTSAIIDPDMETGFPTQTIHLGGTYRSGPALSTLVGNIDEDPRLEIVVSGTASGPLYAWHSDGSIVSGWPRSLYAMSYPAMGTLTHGSSILDIVAPYNMNIDYTDVIAMFAYSGSGDIIAAWPLQDIAYATSPPSLGDVDVDGLDEIFLGQEDFYLHGYKADGSILSGWPVPQPGEPLSGGQERHTPALADLDDDGLPEIISTSGYSSGCLLFAYHSDGEPVTGFPVPFDCVNNVFPVVGDVDADGSPEIILVCSIYSSNDYGRCYVQVISHTGQVERTMPVTGRSYRSASPVLADLDNDGQPEIIVQAAGGLNVWKGDGSTFPGWPVILGNDSLLDETNPSPVVGDVDGDGFQDIVILTYIDGQKGSVRAYNRNGVMLPAFPKIHGNLGNGAVPAIADIDLDGRNEIIITGSYSSGSTEYIDRVWVYDLGGIGHGRVEWGQFMGGPRHQGLYIPYREVKNDFNNDVIFDFDSGTGIWARYNNTTWAKLHNLSSEIITSGDLDGNGEDDCIMDFGAGIGIYVRYNNATWSKLHNLSPEIIATGDLDGSGQDDCIIDFGSGVGIYVRYNNQAWMKLHSLSPEIIKTGDLDGNGEDDCVVDFGLGIGVYVFYNNTGWTKLHSLSPEIMAIGDLDGSGQDDCIMDFGPGIGIWARYNNTSWTKLHSLSAEIITTGDLDGNGQNEAIMDFGPGIGIWVRYNNTSWKKLHSMSAEIIETGDLDGNGRDECVIDFGSGIGVYVFYNNASWTKLHSLSPEIIAMGNLDGN